MLGATAPPTPAIRGETEVGQHAEQHGARSNRAYARILRAIDGKLALRLMRT
jgi:hypothetical protein